jgi:translation initiation factor 2B subunit (eIF-2B alpha/beta/delta family)
MEFKDKTFSNRLNFIKQHVTNLWHPHSTPIYYYTPHDITHSQGVIDSLYQLIPEEKHCEMGDEEWFLLLSAAWLHDIGMIPGLFKGDKYPKKSDYDNIRADHHLRSKEYVLKKQNELGLTVDEADLIGILCKYHRRREDIETCPDIKVTTSLKLIVLASYLRLADAIHIDNSRVSEYESLYNMYLVEGMPLDSEFHWLRSFWIREIKPDPQKATIEIQFRFKENIEIDDIDLLIKLTLDDVSEELDSCKNVLIKEGISYYIDVVPKFGVGIEDGKNKMKLTQIISKLKTDHTASSNQLANITIDTIEYMVNLTSEGEEEIFNMIQRYKDGEIEDMIMNRSCHILVKQVQNIINKYTNIEIKADTNFKTIINNMKKELHTLRNNRKEAITKLSEYARPFLSDFGTILLFGYSISVIAALENIEDEEIKRNTKIYICECRSKNQYNYKNELIYCDGWRYVKRIREIGFEKVYFTPDIIVGNLISRKKVNKIIFGANTVDIKNDRVGHTAGHMTFIDSATKHKVPVYIMADKSKFGTFDENPEDERTINWFTGDRKLLSEFNKKGVIFFNPRSDAIPIESIFTFITEYGSFPPSQIPPIFK